MSRTVILCVVIALILAACGSQSPATAPPESYPAPQQPESESGAESLTETEEFAYPPPYYTATPLAYPYPVPEGGIEVFVIVPEESEVSYEVGETFLDQNNRFNLAIGVTPEVTGEVYVDRNNPQNSTIGPISVDISQFTSDSPRRDSTIRDRFLESTKFPIAVFTPQELQGLPETYQEGEQVSFQVSGDLTVREVTKPVTFDVVLSGEGDTMTGEATTVILLSDFEVGPISIIGILNTEDEAKLTFKFVARK
jgi:polyisoprenoid-binding protein YceI/predicted small lipoprotein YifL